MTRVFVPMTLAGLARVRAAREVGSPHAAWSAHAVTPALREWYASGDAEELEYAALTRAARASLSLLAADPSCPRRRVVVAVDLTEQSCEPMPVEDPSAVRITGVVPWTNVGAVHVDDVTAEPDVAEAVAALPGSAHDADLLFTVEAVEDHELLWYAVQEIDDLMGDG